MTSKKLEIITLEDRDGLSEKDWESILPESVEKILKLLGVEEIETMADLNALINTKKTPFKALQKNILIDFYGTWCGPCNRQDRMFAQHGVEILKKCFPDLKLYRCNVDRDKKIDRTTRKMGIESIPILIFLNDNVNFMRAGSKKIETIVEYINEHASNKDEEEIKKILK